MRLSLSVLMLFAWGAATAQPSLHQNLEFVLSFQETQSKGIINAAQVSSSGQKMSDKEATDYAYSGDTSRLYCSERIINMENERDFYIVRNKLSPLKCFRLTTASFYLIAIVKYDCRGVNFPLWQELRITIIDKKGHLKDSIVVHRATDYDYEIASLINPGNNKIFIIRIVANKHTASLIRVNPNSLKFESEDFAPEVKNVSDNLIDVLKGINWIDKFYQ